MMKTTGQVLLVLGVMILTVWLFAYFLFIRPTTPVTNVKRYGSIVSDVKRAFPSASYFPDRIPQSATATTFYYLPKYLQGSLVLRLRVSLPPTETADLERRLQAQHIPLTPGEVREVAQIGIPPSGMQLHRGEWLLSRFEPISSDFNSFLIGTDIQTIKTTWNHACISGISVSTLRNEVVYWFDQG